jgi:hypothetical protein
MQPIKVMIFQMYGIGLPCHGFEFLHDKSLPMTKPGRKDKKQEFGTVNRCPTKFMQNWHGKPVPDKKFMQKQPLSSRCGHCYFSNSTERISRLAPFISRGGVMESKVANKITKDWQRELPKLGINRPMSLLRRVGPLLVGVSLEREFGSRYTPTFHVHFLGKQSPGMLLSLYWFTVNRTNWLGDLDSSDGQKRVGFSHSSP